MAPACCLSGMCSHSTRKTRYDPLVLWQIPSPAFDGAYSSPSPNCRTEAQGLALLGLNLLAGKGGIMVKKPGLRNWQWDTWTSPLRAMGEEPVEVPPNNKHIKSDALLKSKADNYFPALCTHLASDRQNLPFRASPTDCAGYSAMDGFWSLVLIWVTFQNDSLDLSLWVLWTSTFALGKTRYRVRA